jgi:eukaryotic-like serine/threonine-protein kinase
VRSFDLNDLLFVPSRQGRQDVPEEKMQTAAREGAPGPFGPFILTRRIAIGGAAEVFLARPRQGNKPAPELVIKRLSRARGKNPDFDVLSREAELHRAVRHPNVVTVFGAGMVGDEPYLAMEYVPGVDLHRLLRLAAGENKLLSHDVAAYITRSIADALHAVHTAEDARGTPLNITHGDVSPSNIYLSVTGEVKLGDFGIARAQNGKDAVSRGTRSGEILKGKVGYLAPEHLKGAPTDRRSDIFALGVVLGEMLLGEKMFSGSGQLATLISNRDANIEPLRRVSERLPAPLYQACTRALETDPDRRFLDAPAFAESLGPFNLEKAKAALAEQVAWARDNNLFARQLERRLGHASGASLPSASVSTSAPIEIAGSSVRRGGAVTHESVTFSTLLELAATGYLGLEDEVSLLGAAYRRVGDIPDLARHLMPSTANTTAQLFEPGVPDYTTALRETSMLSVLARMRNRRESGAVFVSRAGREGGEERKDLYLERGRLIHVASSDREELLGQYMLRLKLINRVALDQALANVRRYEGRLGEALVEMGLAERGAVQRAVRNLARDRVAALCSWREGRVQLYRGSKPASPEAPFELDLAVPMMAAAMHSQRGGESAGPRGLTLVAGRRHEDATSAEERGSAPSSLLDVLETVSAGPAASEEIIAFLIERGKARDRVVSEREAVAALQVALALEWLRPA